MFETLYMWSPLWSRGICVEVPWWRLLREANRLAKVGREPHANLWERHGWISGVSPEKVQAAAQAIAEPWIEESRRRELRQCFRLVG